MSSESSDEPTSELLVLDTDAGKRLDVFLVEQLPHYSRAQLRRVIHARGVLVDGQVPKAAFRVRAGQQVLITLPELPAETPTPENIPLKVLYEDEDVIALDKPPAMVVHPGRGHWSGTLTNALAYHFEQLSDAGGAARPGIVHRLDRDTSGVIVIAKTNQAHMQLTNQFADRTVEKEYFAILAGVPDRDRDTVDKPIGVHPYQREKMAIRANHVTSRSAVSHYEVLERFDGFATVRVLPKTGRTHQIRVHMAHAAAPVLCDRLYGGRAQITRGEIRRSEDDEVVLARQALHARRLQLEHPMSGQTLRFEAPLPDDLQVTLDELQAYRRL